MKIRASLKLTALALAAISFAGLGHNAYAGAGIFGSDNGLQLNGGAFTFYENTLQGDGRHNPLVVGGVTAGPTLVTTGLPGSLGSFNPFTGDSLLLIGGEALTFKNGGTDVTGAFVNYSIDGGAFSSISLTFNEDSVNGAVAINAGRIPTLRSISSPARASARTRSRFTSAPAPTVWMRPRSISTAMVA